jgi:hypothetical protein
MRFPTSLLIPIALIALCGCASPRAPLEQDALARLMHPVEGKSVIYVFRNEQASAPWRIGVAVDGKSMGRTRVQTYFRWSVEPGRHIIVSESEHPSTLIMDTEAGQVYYVWLEVSSGVFHPRSTLWQVDRSTAEIALRTCYLLANPG